MFKREMTALTYGLPLAAQAQNFLTKPKWHWSDPMPTYAVTCIG